MRTPTRHAATGSGYRIAWLRAFLTRGSGLDFDDEQAAQVAELAERKLVDLFDVAYETALANGRAKIFWHDLPLSKGLRAQLGEVEGLARDLDARTRGPSWCSWPTQACPARSTSSSWPGFPG
jgi:hypothetical protein